MGNNLEETRPHNRPLPPTITPLLVQEAMGKKVHSLFSVRPPKHRETHHPLGTMIMRPGSTTPTKSTNTGGLTITFEDYSGVMSPKEEKTVEELDSWSPEICACAAKMVNWMGLLRTIMH